jgi:predicted phage-related endonuclease
MSEELLWRRDVLGASDAPAVVGTDPFRTVVDLWAEKTGRIPSGSDHDGAVLNQRSIGSALEPLLLQAAARDLGVPLAPQVWYRHPDAPLGCSVDGLALEATPPTLVEAKTCGILNRPSRLLAAYGEDGTDEVPESVLIQVTHALVVLAAQPNLPPIRDALVMALLGDGRGLRRYHVAFDPALAEELLGAELDFWRKHVEADERPRDEPPSMATLQAWRRRADVSAVPVDPVIMLEWLAARAAAKQAVANEDTFKRMLLAELGDAEAGSCEHGRITYLPITKKAYTVRASTYRTLRYYELKGAAA